MREPCGQVFVYQRRSARLESARSVISLHSHTYFSREGLEFLPQYVSKIPLVSRLYSLEMERYHKSKGAPLDFSKIAWNPPASPEAVLASELGQMREILEGGAFVSITDHDNMDAAISLKREGAQASSIFSTEWSLPFQGAVLHLGVHNLPEQQAAVWMGEMNRYTRHPRPGQLVEILEGMAANPETLLVFNHPLWDHACLGKERQTAVARAFISGFRPFIHALEFNGHRGQAENVQVMELASSYGAPVVCGGDRHGLACNAALNLSPVSDFNGFVEWVRGGRAAGLLLMPDYFAPSSFRVLQTIGGFLGNHLHYPLQWQSWTDRIKIRVTSHIDRPLSHFWRNGGPLWLKMALRLVGMAAHPCWRPAFQLALNLEGNHP